MLYQHIVISSQKWLYFALFAVIIFSANVLYAQEMPEQKSYTAPRELKQWVFLGNSETSKFEYELKTLVRMDSAHLRIRIKETPLKQYYYDTKLAKMWQQRSIQGYSDSQKLHPKFNYEGYDRYGFTISEEEINFRDRKYTILDAADYDLAGALLAKRETMLEVERAVFSTSPENMTIDLFFESKTKNIVKNQ